MIFFLYFTYNLQMIQKKIYPHHYYYDKKKKKKIKDTLHLKREQKKDLVDKSVCLSRINDWRVMNYFFKD